VDARLEVYRKVPNVAAVKAELARATALQGEIWNQAVTACQGAGSQPATMLLLSALNQMIDITTIRTMAAQTHPPMVIFAMLGGLARPAARSEDRPQLREIGEGDHPSVSPIHVNSVNSALASCRSFVPSPSVNQL